ncbi:MAG: iron-containing alcohol dehydrogenase [Clostridia bacterium]|nr:iron-containing alcohol dehydrogenase [Clostridia bacterium]
MYKFFMPTRVYYGKNALIDNVGELKLGSRAFIVTGKNSGRASGALFDVENALGLLKIPYEIYDRISNNPTIEECVEGARVAREFGTDFIIGIGGGSPLDAAKAIAVYTANEPVENSDFEMMDIYNGVYKNRPLPMAAIPTTAGTGSEVTPYSVLTLHSEKSKRTFSSPDTFYKVAFVDGKYLLALPLQTLRNTVVDAISHLIEGYTNKRSNPITDCIALEGLKIIGDNISALLEDKLEEEQAQSLIYASTLAGIVIAQTGTTTVHSMGYPLTYFKNIPHGMANGLILGEYLEETEKVIHEKVENVLSAMKLKSITEFKEMLKALLPHSFTFKAEETDEWAITTSKAKNTLVSPFEVTLEKEREMFKKALL